MKKRILIGWLGLLAVAAAGPFAPQAGSAGSTAIAADDARFVSWANGNLPPEYGSDVDARWRTPETAWGPATTDIYDIVCLGNGGRLTMVFPHPVRNGEGADFAVFENAHNHTFLELAFVEVSSDGVNFFRFPGLSETPGIVGAFGGLDPTNIHNLAGKYRAGFGTPFDLSDLPDSPLLDKERVRFVRVVDIVGDGSAKDGEGRPIYDPSPVVGSGGFDLNAIGVIHQNDGGFGVMRAEISGGNFEIEWESNPGSRYRVETSATMVTPPGWTPIWDGAGSQKAGTTVLPVPMTDEPKRFWRVVRLD